MGLFMYYYYFGCMSFSFILLMISTWFEVKNLVVYMSMVENFSCSKMIGDMVIMVDWMVVIFLFILLMMVGSVGLFSLKYMLKDEKIVRFFWMLQVFVYSMIVVMMTPHYIIFLLGWDGLGFSSFLLMSYYKSAIAWSSSLKTFLINRLGDGILLSSMGVLMVSGHFFFFLEKVSMLFFFFCLSGLLTKSAHFPFSMWLPAAMAAPTPVSSLVHSSTLVTSGLYVLFRLNFFFISVVKKLVLVMGLVTLFVGSLCAMKSFDSKKIVAYSTLSKLGLMGVSVGVGLLGLSVFHLFTHGMSKALLFLSVGQMMKKKKHEQDIRVLGSSYKNMVFSTIKMVWSVLSLVGLFFFSCFFSKDYILESLMFSYNVVVSTLLLMSLMFTFTYSFRLLSTVSKLKEVSKSSSVIFHYSSGKNNFFYSKVFLFFSVLFMGNYVSFFFFFLVESVVFKKVVIVMLYFMVSFWVYVSFGKFSFILDYFKSSFFLGLSYIGSFFYSYMDKGFMIELKSRTEAYMNSVSVESKGGSLMKVSIKGLLYSFIIVFLLLFFFF